MEPIGWEQDRAVWRAMAAPVGLQLPGLAAEPARAAADAVRADLEATEQALSRFRPGAELVRLNAQLGRRVPVSPRLYAALSAALRAFRRTAGLFDPRVLARLQELGYPGAGPAGAAFAAAPAAPWLERDPRRRTVLARAPLDLGGIGKGLAVRWGARVARGACANFLLDAGGDLVAEGPGPGGAGWRIGVEDPRAPGALIAALHLPRGGAVCTSSVARRRWMHAGRVVHHLIDPRTGEPGGRGLLAVTVVGADPAWAEVWSKALFLRGADAIRAAAGARAALWVTTAGRLAMTGAAERLVFWQAAGGAPAAPASGARTPRAGEGGRWWARGARRPAAGRSAS